MPTVLDPSRFELGERDKALLELMDDRALGRAEAVWHQSAAFADTENSRVIARNQLGLIREERSRRRELVAAAAMTAEEAAAIVAGAAGRSDAEAIAVLLHDPELAAVVYRQAREACHPNEGGDREAFHRLQQAWATLEGDT